LDSLFNWCDDFFIPMIFVIIIGCLIFLFNSYIKYSVICFCELLSVLF
jgi:hypothetical protein